MSKERLLWFWEPKNADFSGSGSSKKKAKPRPPTSATSHEPGRWRFQKQGTPSEKDSSRWEVGKCIPCPCMGNGCNESHSLTGCAEIEEGWHRSGGAAYCPCRENGEPAGGGSLSPAETGGPGGRMRQRHNKPPPSNENRSHLTSVPLSGFTASSDEPRLRAEDARGASAGKTITG